MMLMAVLTLAWGCSPDGDSEEEKWENSTFEPAAKPTWTVDWTSTATKPDWQDPDPTKFDPNASMSYLVELDEELTRYSTDNDVMAVFIKGECRGVSTRNKTARGTVYFLLHIKGVGSEAGQPLELRYYCDQLHHMNILPVFTYFVPSNIVSAAFKRILNVGDGSSKYPVCTQLTVTMPQKLPFTANANDLLAVFVSDKCKGVGKKSADGSWLVPTYGAQAGETAQIRYYSAEKTGVYTILKTIKLEGATQQENISF